MPQIGLSTARIIDPVLTNIAQGYQQSDLVGRLLFPRVPVGMRAGKIIQFSKEDFMLYASQRSPGENTKRIQFGYANTPYALVDYSLEASLPIELIQEAAAGENGFSIDMMGMSVRKVINIFDLRLEKAQADIARTAGNYGAQNRVTLSGTSQWSDFSGVSDPIANVETAKEQIRSQTGKRPNVMIMGPQVFAKLKQHPKIIDRIKYTGRDVPTPELLGALFGIQTVVVGEAIYSDDAGTFSDAWGKDVVLAFTETAGIREMGAPTYGYTYNLNGYPLVEEAYWEPNAKSWFAPVTRSEAPYLTAAAAGYLIVNAVA